MVAGAVTRRLLALGGQVDMLAAQAVGRWAALQPATVITSRAEGMGSSHDAY